MPHNASQARGTFGPPKRTPLVPARSAELSLARPNRPAATNVQSETRSTSSASTATAVSSEAQHVNVGSTNSPLNRHKEGGSNIKVVVRCR